MNKLKVILWLLGRLRPFTYTLKIGLGVAVPIILILVVVKRLFFDG